jgi:HEPN domain-containing protein
MDKSEKVKYWIDISDYDMETAKTMLDGKRYLYVGFMCHQAVEKILKAYFTAIIQQTPPFVHKTLFQLILYIAVIQRNS